MSEALAPTNQQAPFSVIAGVNGNQRPLSFPRTAKKEYVAGGGYGTDISLTLAHRSDALTRKFGDAIIAKMLRDPEVNKCITVIKIGVLADGVTFFPALSKPAPYIKRVGPTVDGTAENERERKYKEDYEKYLEAERYAEFATRAIENLDASFRSILDNMLDAICFGNKVAEITYQEIPSRIVQRDWKELLPYKDSPVTEQELWTLKSIRVKPRNSIYFEVDRFMKLVGFRSPYAEKGAEDKILPRKKFCVLTFRGKDGDPRGQSILEPVYNAWHLKMQMWPEYLRWLLQCAIPGLVGYTSNETDNKRYIRNPETGELEKDADGNPLYEADVDTLLAALIQVRNSTAIALPYGAKVEPINNSVSGDPFKGMRDVLNEEIEMGLILQTLATSEGRNMSRAAAQSHMSVLDLWVWFIKGLVMDMITSDILKPLFTANFGEDFDFKMLPKVSMGDTERREFATDLVAVSTGVKAGFITKSQFIGYDKLIGAPDRDVEADEEDARIQSEQQLRLKTATPEQAVSSGDTRKPASGTKIAPDKQRQVRARLDELILQYEELFGEN